MEKKRSWACTLVTQVSLCVAFYVALNLGRPQYLVQQKRIPLDIHFISVSGGYRTLQQQTLLLKQMENVMKLYNVSFVLNISELGEDDPLRQNASRLFPSLNTPWYTTKVSQDGNISCFLEHINFVDGKMLTVLGLDMGSLQFLHTLRVALVGCNFRLIVAGYHPLVYCNENKNQMEAKQGYESLQHLFLKYGVNVYVSRQGCTNPISQSGVSYIGIPNSIESGPYLASLSSRSAFQKEMVDGLLLHRVTPIEIVSNPSSNPSYLSSTTYFVTSAGEVMNRIPIQQRGRDVM
ncbi:hypothetical protein Tsubulata_005751 [Turnera subulata]|uniref:Uncharacterized protein n=1 Tax=Turnera subulata TaxID=218843 RepID=A0A9Q0GAW8_9ROSI|nr:hypothetical protein Tsubulata_005751 [Turnera subulata]